MCILARDMRLTGAKAAGKRTARPATFPLDPRTAPPRIWRLLSNVPHGSHPIRVAAWHMELLFGGPGRVETPRPGPGDQVIRENPVSK